MWAEPTKNGKVKYKEQYTDIYGNRKRVSVTMDKDTARNRRQAYEILTAKMKAPDVDNLTLSELADLYLASQKLTVKESSCNTEYYAMESLKAILGADTRLSALNARKINFALQGKDLPAKTANGHIKHFKALMRWAYDYDYVDDISWLDKIQLQKTDGKTDDKYLESADLKKLLDAMTIQKWKFLTQLTALSGMRVGEAIALDRKDIDLTERVIHINKTYNGNTHHVSTPKTAASYRDVYMQDELLDLCREILKYMADERRVTNIASPLFLHDVNGQHLNYQAYNSYLRDVSMRTLGRRITTHYMRHTHVALLAEQGVPLDVISRRLGHGDSEVTREVYFHVTEKLKEKDNEKLKDIKLI